MNYYIRQAKAYSKFFVYLLNYELSRYIEHMPSQNFGNLAKYELN